MKKWIAMLLCAALLTTLAGCRRDRAEQSVQDETAAEEVAPPEDTTVEEATPPEDTAAEETAPSKDTAAEEAAPHADEKAPSAEQDTAAPQENAAAAAGGMSARLRRAFEEAAADEPGSDLRELAEEIADECDFPFEVTVTDAAEGPLAGFGDTAVEGFSEGVMFAPTVSTIPFIGYVFRAEDEAAAKALLSKLSENADLRWNVCTEAETVVSEQIGNVAFFAMTAEAFDA